MQISITDNLTREELQVLVDEQERQLILMKQKYDKKAQVMQEIIMSFLAHMDKVLKSYDN